MSIAEFITTIRNQGVQIKFHDGALKVALPKEINPKVKSELVRRKEEIKAYLGGQLTTTTQSEITLSDQPKSRRPLSVAQQRLWFIAQMEPLSSSYNMPLVLNIKGAFSVAHAERALLEIMARHEVLRTSYHEENGEVYQRLNSVPECLIESIDMRSVAESDRQQQVEAVIQETTRRPFELSSSPLLRVYWIQCSASQSDTQQGYLLLNLHHIAADAWSMEVLFDEFNFYYQQFSSASQAALPALELQYSDYAIWQASYLDEQTLQAQQNYWLEQLKGIPAVHSLPLDFVRPAKLTSQGSHYSLPLTREVAAAIADLAKRFHTTPFVIFHAAWSLLLARHSHEQDIVIGTPVAGRTHPQLGRLIGLFVNTLVLRAEVDESATLAEYVAALKAVNLAAQQHQDIPFDQVVDVLNPPRSQSHNPVFQIMLNMLQGNATKSTSSQATGSELSVTQSDDGQSNVVCDLILNVIEQDQQFELKFEYNTGLFTTQRIVMLAEQLSVLLAQMGQQPEQRLSTYTMLSPSAAEALCHPKPAYQPSRSSATTIHQLFEQQAHLNPEHEALCWADGAMSYAQLNARANRLAHTLITQYQVRAGDLVGICSPKTPELIVAILAVLKAGAGYVPLAPDFPVERIELMVADTQARLVLSCAEMFDSLTQLAVSTVTLLLNEQTEHTDSYPPANPVVDELTPDHLAYVIYTSGSTGQPKGVMVEHRNVMALLSQPSFIESASARRVASLSSYAFDGFVFDMFYPLLRGQTLVLLDKSEILDERVLNQRLCELRVEAFFATTSLFNQMVINDTFRGTSIKAVLMGGEQASAEVVQQALTRYPDIRFTNAYGPTETTVFACAHHFSDPIGRVPIGRAINDTQVFVLNNDLQPVATGVIAQLYIGGPTLARGYLNQPELSAERFIDNPYFDAQQPHSSARLYQTGDLVRRLPDGALEFIGRVDEQVKIRGFRIELGEIAQQMMRLPAVESAVVLVKELAQGKQLVAYVQPVAMPEQSDDYIAQLRERLRDSLPAYMIPSVIMLLPALPLTRNGKLDKRALPAPEVQLDESACVAPVTSLEKALVGIWSEMLNIPEP
ncbi:amino acid adenylation domain-containing protein, partial [Pseudoalteromonas rubra]|uniref:non-ribosomal peptide synthetase n=1 Tax=Pseudoalteromonas rubra TaxID=43658 RepID=UPI000F7AE4E3